MRLFRNTVSDIGPNAQAEGRRILRLARLLLREHDTTLQWQLEGLDVVLAWTDRVLRHWRYALSPPLPPDRTCACDVVVRNIVVLPDELWIALSVPPFIRQTLGGPAVGGVHFRLRRNADGSFTLEVFTYVERLVCTNGLVVKEERVLARFEVADIRDLPSRLTAHMPDWGRDIDEGLKAFVRSVSFDAPPLEVFRGKPYGLSDDQFAHVEQAQAAEIELTMSLLNMEPEGTLRGIDPRRNLFHLVNSVTRAANLYADEAGPGAAIHFLELQELAGRILRDFSLEAGAPPAGLGSGSLGRG